MHFTNLIIAQWHCKKNHGAAVLMVVLLPKVVGMTREGSRRLAEWNTNVDHAYTMLENYTDPDSPFFQVMV